MRKRTVLTIAGLVSLLLVAGAWRFHDRQENPVVFDIAIPVRGDLVQAVTATGSLQPKRTVDIKYDGQELIETLSAREGDRVHRGQIVARMDTRVLAHQYSQNRQAIEKDQASLTQAEAAYRRQQALFQNQIVARAELETYQANYQALVHQVKGDQQAALETRQQMDRACLRSPVNGIVTEVYVHAGEMLGSATAVAGLGPSAAVNKPTNVVMTIAEGGELSAYADVNAADLGNVYEGQPAEISIDAFRPEVFHGNVERVALQPVVLNNVTTYQVIVNVQHPNQRFRMGIPVDVMLFRTIASGAWILPPQALRHGAAGDSVCILRQQPAAPDGQPDRQPDRRSDSQHAIRVKAEMAPVRLLGRTSDEVAVEGRLSARDWVAAAASQCGPASNASFAIQPRTARAPERPGFHAAEQTAAGAESATLLPAREKSWLQRMLGL